MVTKNFSNHNSETPTGKTRRYIHQPLTVDHFGTKIEIKSNGRVCLTSASRSTNNSEDPDEVEYDEIEVSAAVILKAARLLQDTRKIEYVDAASPKNDETNH